LPTAEISHICTRCRSSSIKPSSSMMMIAIACLFLASPRAAALNTTRRSCGVFRLAQSQDQYWQQAPLSGQVVDCRCPPIEPQGRQ
jgi:hypothetical protein